ncbi:hypothetical protein JXJ21_09950 [candidate division KSB1 bacterium]|nr:hypothetical protein [candidate division KSB1 bacterium]
MVKIVAFLINIMSSGLKSVFSIEILFQNILPAVKPVLVVGLKEAGLRDLDSNKKLHQIKITHINVFRTTHLIPPPELLN